MTVKRSYRLPESDSEHCYTPVTDGRCRECFQRPQRCAVPDTRLQDIADAWRESRQLAPENGREFAEVIALLDALTKE